MTGRIALISLISALTLSGCATVPKLGAGQDVHDFLVAVRDGDQATFERHVDRPALKTQMRSRALAEAPALLGQQNLGTLGALLAGPIVDIAVDALVQPEVFRAVAVRLGYSPDQPIPNALLIARELRALDGQRVCAVEKDRCTLVFAKEEGVWRLVAYEGDLGRLSTRLSRPRS
jgi:hypothetical protein